MNIFIWALLTLVIGAVCLMQSTKIYAKAGVLWKLLSISLALCTILAIPSFGIIKMISGFETGFLSHGPFVTYRSKVQPADVTCVSLDIRNGNGELCTFKVNKASHSLHFTGVPVPSEISLDAPFADK